MIISVMQPTYLPWLGYFDLIDSADKFVFLDNVKLEKSDWHVRNRIKSASGELMLTCPVATPNGRLSAQINTTEFASGHPWRKKHLKSIEACYRKAPFFEQLYPLLKHYFEASYSYRLGQFNIGLIILLADYIGIESDFYIASELPSMSGVKDGKLVSICEYLQGDTYFSPLGAKAYIESTTPGGELAKNDINVLYQNFKHPEYTQLFGGFISHLAVVDSLFNVGPEKTLLLIRKGHQSPIKYSEL
ncbi:WbqC family protein [Pseudoalteromonas sp. SSM20]|uniref:WbqC family protein n=1 Tax=unclassified Pseudoalteromonas TaxID=194690 RepID=UPI00237E7DF1|nr:WbqC family protein [Pseudoalteromonas sp. G4]MDE3271734.1 WbqC family protein [Pseudoalteromonas sp. G4]